MYYRNSEIPTNYNKIAELGDNYIVWVKESKLYSNQTYNAFVQYFKPCFYYIYLENYTINKGTNYNLQANYNNNGMYNYIEDYNLIYELETSTQTSGDDYNTNIKYIADYNDLHIATFCLLIVIIWVFNQISKLWTKGGCFK